jgi:hypothetical protein
MRSLHGQPNHRGHRIEIEVKQQLASQVESMAVVVPRKVGKNPQKEHNFGKASHPSCHSNIMN